MWNSHSASVALLFLFGLGSCSGCNSGSFGWNNKVDIRDVQLLTLKSGRLTTGRRWDPIPQLKCVGGSAGCENIPDVVECYNRGSSGINVQWECTATLDEKYEFGEMSVNCEGYHSPNDPYILTGSCALEYTLEFANQGSPRPHRYQYRHGGVVYHHYYHRDDSAFSPIHLPEKPEKSGVSWLLIVCGTVLVCVGCSIIFFNWVVNESIRNFFNF